MLSNLSEAIKVLLLAMKQNKWLSNIAGYNSLICQKYEKHEKLKMYDNKKGNVVEIMTLKQHFSQYSFGGSF